MQTDRLINLGIGAAIVLLVIVLFVWLAKRAAANRRKAFAEEEQRDQVSAREHPDEARALEQAAAGEDDASAEAEVPSASETTAPTTKRTVDMRLENDIALDRGLERTRSSFWGKITGLFGSGQIDAKVLEGLEEALITADVGVGLATRFVEEIRTDWKAKKIESPDAVKAALKSKVAEALGASKHVSDPLVVGDNQPYVILFVGVNGVGKTTTIGKIAAQLHSRGESVVLAAGDTFRAAASEQLSVWADRTHAKLIRGDEGADPASVIYNAIEHAKQTKATVVLADTAGRLHTKTDLMDEIGKVKRACSKSRDGAPDETWLVVDATTGQNALQQAKEFNQTLGLTGVILTKLDGTAKGGVVIAIADALKIPVRFVGVGEKAQDLRPFDPRQFVEALFRAS